MKKLLLGTLLPVLAATAVVGSGFAVWYFQDATGALNTAETNGNIVLQNEQINGNSAAEFVNRPAVLTLDLDQKGVEFKTTDDGGFKAIKVQAKQGATDFVAPSSTVTTIMIPKALSAYLTFNYKSQDIAGADTQTGTQTSYTIEWQNADGFNWGDVKVAYKGIDTNSQADYQKLAAALAVNMAQDGTYTTPLTANYSADFNN